MFPDISDDIRILIERIETVFPSIRYIEDVIKSRNKQYWSDYQTLYLYMRILKSLEIKSVIEEDPSLTINRLRQLMQIIDDFERNPKFQGLN